MCLFFFLLFALSFGRSLRLILIFCRGFTSDRNRVLVKYERDRKWETCARASNCRMHSLLPQRDDCVFFLLLGREGGCCCCCCCWSVGWDRTRWLAGRQATGFSISLCSTLLYSVLSLRLACAEFLCFPYTTSHSHTLIQHAVSFFTTRMIFLSRSLLRKSSP